MTATDVCAGVYIAFLVISAVLATRNIGLFKVSIATGVFLWTAVLILTLAKANYTTFTLKGSAIGYLISISFTIGVFDVIQLSHEYHEMAHRRTMSNYDFEQEDE